MEKVQNVLVKDADLLKMGVSYTEKGANVKYGKTSVGIVKSPYSGEYELAVKPYYRNKFGDWVELYSFEDDIQYAECMKIISDCEFSGKQVPKDVETFVQSMIAKKNYARKQANATVEEETGIKGVETGYSLNKWRDDVIATPEAQKMLETYKAKHPTETTSSKPAAKSSGKVQ